MEHSFQAGDIVQAEYRSGVYAGELVSVASPKAKLRVMAVLKHPTQGDLHHAFEADVPIFHERKALAHREVCNVWIKDVQPFDGELPNYRDSLMDALAREEEQVRDMLDRDGYAEWAGKALERLEALRREYVKSP